MVKNVMEDIPATCEQKDTLHSVAKKMLRDNIAFIPIVDKESRFLGMISDRDVTLSLGKNENRPLSELTVKDVITGKTQTIAPEENIESALRIMRRKRLKCLPVVDNKQRLRGMVSLNRIVKKINESIVENKIAKNETEYEKIYFEQNSNLG